MICFAKHLRLEYYGFVGNISWLLGAQFERKGAPAMEHNEYNQHSLSSRIKTYKC